MKLRNQYFFTAVTAITLTVITIISCNKKFDQPPTFEEPNVTVNCTIKALKARHIKDNFEQIIGDTIISGIIVADDRSGNFYKSIVIQDASGGITVRLDGTSLFVNYPVGRRIYIKCKGLYLGVYGGLIQLGGGIDLSDPTRPSLDPLASSLFDKYVLKGSLGNAVTPRPVIFSQLTTNIQDTLQSTLISIANTEFSVGDTAKTFADPTIATSAVNFTIRSCTATGSVVLRNSSYSAFAGINVPNGNGTLTGIYNIFGSTKQIQIRDTADVKFTGARCGSGPASLMNISTLRALHTSSSVTIPNGTKITGVVISDRSTANLVDQNLVLQQGNALSGIVVRFADAHRFNLGDSIEINVSNESLEEFAGVLQVNGVDTTAAVRLATNKTITPRIATIAAINTNSEIWESTLVSIADATLSPTGAWNANSGNTTVTDATGNLICFSRNSATFANTVKPATAVAFINGVVGQFNTTKQIQIRNLSDVGGPSTGGGTGPTPPPSGGIALTTSPLVYNFNNIETSGLPNGISVKTGATASVTGTVGTFVSTKAVWNNVTAGFKNFASATGLTSTADQAAQDAATNRAIGVRQTSGTDMGVSFVFEIDNTTGKSNLGLAFKLQSLDASSPRTATWTVDYATGTAPTTFTPATASGTVTTGNSSFSNNTVNVNFPAALNNVSNKVWIRISILSATTGSGNRPSSAIDDVTFTWN